MNQDAILLKLLSSLNAVQYAYIRVRTVETGQGSKVISEYFISTQKFLNIRILLSAQLKSIEIKFSEYLYARQHLYIF